MQTGRGRLLNEDCNIASVFYTVSLNITEGRMQTVVSLHCCILLFQGKSRKNAGFRTKIEISAKVPTKQHNSCCRRFLSRIRRRYAASCIFFSAVISSAEVSASFSPMERASIAFGCTTTAKAAAVPSTAFIGQKPEPTLL